MLYNIAYYFLVLLLSNAIIQLIIYFTFRKFRNLIYFIDLMLMVLARLYGGLFFSGEIRNFPGLYGLMVPIEAFSFCMAYFIVIYSVDFDYKIRIKDLFIFTPAILSLLYYAIQFFQIPLNQKVKLLEIALKRGQPEHLVDSNTNIYISLTLLFVTFMAYRFLYNRIDWVKVKAETKKKHLIKELSFVTFFLFSLAVVPWLLHHYFQMEGSQPHSRLMLTVIMGELFFLLLVSQVAPQLLKLKLVTRKYEKRNPSQSGNTQSSGFDKSAIEHRLNTLIVQNKILRNSNITLTELAALLSLTRNQLSEYLNRAHNMNFRNFINYHRVQDAKEMLLQQSDKNVSDIAFKVGFNNLSSFYAAFSLFGKTTPAKYRNANGEQ